MGAADELRRILDERGVQWKEHRHVMPGSMAIQRETLWGQPTDVASGKPIPHVYYYRATEMGDGRLFLEAQLVTPEQAIAATVGRGTCCEVEDEDTGFIVCSECGAIHDVDYTSYYCWCCGRKVVGE